MQYYFYFFVKREFLKLNDVIKICSVGVWYKKTTIKSLKYAIIFVILTIAHLVDLHVSLFKNCFWLSLLSPEMLTFKMHIPLNNIVACFYKRGRERRGQILSDIHTLDDADIGTAKKLSRITFYDKCCDKLKLVNKTILRNAWRIIYLRIH